MGGALKCSWEVHPLSGQTAGGRETDQIEGGQEPTRFPQPSLSGRMGQALLFDPPPSSRSVPATPPGCPKSGRPSAGSTPPLHFHGRVLISLSGFLPSGLASTSSVRAVRPPARPDLAGHPLALAERGATVVLRASILACRPMLLCARKVLVRRRGPPIHYNIPSHLSHQSPVPSTRPHTTPDHTHAPHHSRRKHHQGPRRKKPLPQHTFFSSPYCTYALHPRRASSPRQLPCLVPPAVSAFCRSRPRPGTNTEDERERERERPRASRRSLAPSPSLLGHPTGSTPRSFLACPPPSVFEPGSPPFASSP